MNSAERPIARNRIKRQRGVVVFALVMLWHLPAGMTAGAAPATHPATRPAETHPAAERVAQNLFADGTDDYFWMAQVMPAPDQTPPGEQTRISFRTAGTEKWKQLSDLPVRITGMASFGSQLAVLRDGGDWLRLAEGEAGSTGQPLPDGARIAALASDGQTLWAVGVVPPGKAPHEASSASRPSGPSMSPALARLALYVLRDGGWQPADGAMLPADLPADAPLSLALIDHMRYLAVRQANGAIEVLKQTPGTPPGAWKKLAPVAGPQAAGGFSLLSGLSPATLWVAGTGADRLEVLGAEKNRVIPLREMRAPIGDRAAVYAIHAVREIAIVDGKLVEQLYDAQTFKPSGAASSITLPPPSTPPIYSKVVNFVITIALVFAILTSTRRRKSSLDEIGEGAEKLILADMSRRLFAGLIDALPFAAPLVLIVQATLHSSANGENAATAGQHLGMLLNITSMAALLVYLIHTAATEALTGRTIGKMLLGLRVVRLDGGTPDASSLLIRNFLRVLDIGLCGVPLVFILFSPLRQRIGDVAAGTVVVRDRVRPEGNLIEPVKEDEPAKEESPASRAPEPPEAAGE